MQTRSEVIGNDAPRYPEPLMDTNRNAGVGKGRRVAIAIVSWLIPGAGHFILGKYVRGLIFLTIIGGGFVFGLILHGRLYWPAAADPTGAMPIDLISTLWTFAQLGSGLCYGLAYLLGFGLNPQPGASTFEYGNTFMFLAGLLNYLVAIDAFDIAARRKS